MLTPNIACVLSFIFLLATIYHLARRHTLAHSRRTAFCILFLGLLTALLSTIIFLIDVILVAIVRHRIKNDSDGIISLGWGNAVWMTLGATIVLWLALVSSALGVFVTRKNWYVYILAFLTEMFSLIYWICPRRRSSRY